jgi:heme A synthase
MAVSSIDRESGVSSRSIVPGLALSALISTILLIAMGSIVRVTGYGLGCPDWPLCYGRVIPPAVTGAWVEFAHRLLGAFASAQIVLLAVLAWRDYRRRPWVLWPAIATVGLLIIQISLGGVHVIFEIPPVTGWVHTGVAMLIVGLVAVQVAGTLPAIQSLRAVAIFRNRRFAVWLSVTTGATYLLLLTGSYVTRSGASLACPSFPLCGSNAPVAALLVVQLGLGASNVLLRLPMWSRILHLAVAATIWASLVVLWSLGRVRQDVQSLLH